MDKVVAHGESHMRNGEVYQTKQVTNDYVRGFESLLRQIDPEAIDRIVQCLRNASDRGSTIYVAGNGGSAATASHWVNDLGKGTKCAGETPLRVMSLSDNVSWLTALANDEGYHRAFAGQLENFARPGDVLVVISASGNSPNLLEAVELAHQQGMLAIGFLGFDGGALKKKVDDYLWFHTEKGAYGLVESGHSLLCHIVTTCLMRSRPARARQHRLVEAG
jgi:D-sedoheptulose 7-phosphate isomerase